MQFWRAPELGADDAVLVRLPRLPRPRWLLLLASRLPRIHRSSRGSTRAANVAVGFGPRGRFDQGFLWSADHASDCGDDQTNKREAR